MCGKTLETILFKKKLQCYTPSRKRESLTGPGLFSAENKKDLI